MKHLIAFLLGSLFAIGLLISGMANPQKVLNFLDLAGHWDPSLALVMLGAIGVAVWPFHYARRNPGSWLKARLQLPALQTVDRQLVLGAFVFGVGWGIAGICPAPALALLGLGHLEALYFIVAMLAGMYLYRRTLGAR
ncbi:DUF6691 family protein [Alkanindiges sp. WGS2144]|uniref:DUF6691 family protein n=1 Tax=Alkanindiges sp. WGS2144 TaxID=3366808 RepID=UPI003750BC5F